MNAIFVCHLTEKCYPQTVVSLHRFRYYRLMNYRFSALIPKENGWYVARCPELNLTSQGKDVETARTNLTEAIELYIETWGASAFCLS